VGAASKRRETMDRRPSELERAFQLAKSGECASIADIKKQLRWEGYRATQIDGPALFKQLREFIRTAQASHPGSPDGKA
jgi:hypothetical protein